ncbi:nucleotide exchange factor GrpE [Candidatus Daviesbacteria bacterium]|nr:nucleotide exchange factor GrpE [Candidatus Daviesbacteria bacterium]
MAKKSTTQLEQRVAHLEDQLKRAVADYQNLEKRVAEGKSEFASWAASNLIVKILPVLDHLNKALSGAPEQEHQSGWFHGVELAVGELNNVLKQEGLDQIEADGQFDPSLHEAVDVQAGENDKILEVTQTGYTLNGKVLRPAKVVVGRKE